MRRLNCERYPCHFSDQDCAFCFCPFYPCMDERTHGYIEKGTWCCRGCIAIHRPDISDMVMDALMAGVALHDAWKKFEEML